MWSSTRFNGISILAMRFWNCNCWRKERELRVFVNTEKGGGSLGLGWEENKVVFWREEREREIKRKKSRKKIGDGNFLQRAMAKKAIFDGSCKRGITRFYFIFS